MQEAPKRIRRLVREWARIAHDRDLRKALTELGGQFDRWGRGEIDSVELNELRFHQDTSREIWKRYATTHLEAAVASAVAAGCFAKSNCVDRERSEAWEREPNTPLEPSARA